MKELQEKVNKAQENVEKARKSADRYLAKLNKLQAKLATLEKNTDEYRMVNFDVKYCEMDLKSATKKYEEKLKVLANWKEKLANAIKEEKEIPECFKVFIENLAKSWDEYDKNKAKAVKKALKLYEQWVAENRGVRYLEKLNKAKELGCTDSQVDYYIYHTPADWHERNLKDAKNLVKNLVNRVVKKVGEVTSWSGLYITQGNAWEGAVINGTVQGVNGVARVDSITAGGYNIQKLHIRTLVK